MDDTDRLLLGIAWFCGWVIKLLPLLFGYIYIRDVNNNPPSWADRSPRSKVMYLLGLSVLSWIFMGFGNALSNAANLEIKRLEDKGSEQEEIRSAEPNPSPFQTPRAANQSLLREGAKQLSATRRKTGG